MSKSPYKITIRSWVPRKLPYEISQEDLNSSIQSHQPMLPFIYAGWRSMKIDSKRMVRFCVGHGDSRVAAKNAFKGDIPNQFGFFVLPQKEI